MLQELVQRCGCPATVSAVCHYHCRCRNRSSWVIDYRWGPRLRQRLQTLSRLPQQSTSCMVWVAQLGSARADAP